MPFLQAEPSAVRVPVPVKVTDAPDLIFIAEPSKASAISASSESSLAGSSASVITLSPSITIVASAVLLTHIGADVVEVRFRSESTSVTPVVPS